MASYSAIPLQSLNTSSLHGEMHDSHYLIANEPKVRAKVSPRKVSEGSFNGSSNVNSFRKRALPRRAGYGRLAAAWWQEIISFLCAAGFFVAIAIILVKYSGQEQPDWKYGLNLSTLVAILSTLLRVSLVMVVEEIVSQLKWLWHKTTRVTIKPTRIEGVTEDLALLGLTVVVLSLAVGPFTQQAIKNVSCEKDLSTDASSTSTSSLSTAHMPIARRITRDFVTRYAPGQFSMSVDVKGAIVNGLSDPDGNLSAVSAICGSGNCTFPEYSSAGICSKCADVISLISEVVFNDSRSETSSKLILPNGLSIGHAPSDEPSVWLSIASDQNLEWAQISDPVMLAGRPASIHNVTLFQITDANCSITLNSTNKFGTVTYNYDCPQHGKNFSSGWEHYGFQATSCALFPCVKTYHSKVINGAFDEEVDALIPMWSDPSQAAAVLPDQVAFNSPCIVDGKRYDLANISALPTLHRNFNTTEIGGKNVTIPSECFYSHVLYNGRLINIDPAYRINLQCGTPIAGSDSWWRDSWWLQELFNSGNATFGSVESSIDAIATAVTNKVRMSRSNWDGSQAFATGLSTRTTICTQVDWPWLIFPAILLALTLFLLFTIVLRTMFEHGDVPIWKSSLLPLIFASKGSFMTRSGELQDIDNAADDTIVKLERKGDNWEFAESEGRSSSGFDFDDLVRHEHYHQHDEPGPSTRAFLYSAVEDQKEPSPFIHFFAVFLRQGLFVSTNGSVNMTIQQDFSSTENWQLFYQSGIYFIRNYQSGADLQLGLTEDDLTTPRLLIPSGDLGQQWTITARSDTTWRITNGLLSNVSSLGIATGGATVPAMDTDDADGHWQIGINQSAGTIEDESMLSSVANVVSSTATSTSPSSTATSTGISSGTYSAATSTSTLSSSSSSSSKSSGISGGAIAGIVIGVLALIAIIAALALFLIRKRKQRITRSPVPQSEMDGTGKPFAYENEKRITPAAPPVEMDAEGQVFRTEMGYK
ncbi:hypothetical protein FKW77_003680 [Venturia effusa]|uniref:Ricin B lectin domain-containing protein n=1 Tax=Venturia effusa TaxID=50376 RepID=A0A517LGX9_9PEZI|nr:hypothetical protein FKW77_003680 [Venturia effusa]